MRTFFASWGGRFSPSARRLLWMTAIDGLVISGWSLFFNLYILERGFSRQFLGLLNSLPSLSGLFFGLPLGRLADRIGYRLSMILGLALSTVAMVIQVSASSPSVIILAALVNGIAGTLFIVSQAPLVMHLADDEETRTLLFSLNYGLQTIAGAVGNLFAGQLPALFGEWLGVPARSAEAYRAVLIASVLSSSLAIVPLWGIREHSAGREKSAGKGFLTVGTQIVRMALPNVLIGFGAAILIPYMNVFFVERFGLSARWLGVLFAMASLLIGLGSLIAPRLAARLGSKIRAVILTQSSSILFLLLIGFSPWVELAGLAFLLRAMFMNMAAPLYTAFCMEKISPSERGLANSALNISWQIGWAVGPYLSGLVQQHYGFTPLFIATATLYSIAVLLLRRFFLALEPVPPFAKEVSLER